MKLALLFTGSYRSFTLLADKIYENLVKPNDATCFIFYEHSENKDEFIHQKFGKHIGICKYSKSTRDEEFSKICDMILSTGEAVQKPIFDKVGWPQNYVVNSGSILEYYQYMKCFDLLLQYERENNMKFDIIARTRLDLFFFEKMYFKNFFENINEEMREKYGDDIYLRSLGNETMASILNTKQLCEIGTNLPVIIDRNLKIDNMLEFINNNSHIWTFGANNFWIGKRNIMMQTKYLVYNYGKYNSGFDFTFNSETQFCYYCINNNILRYFYLTENDADYWFDAKKVIEYIQTGKIEGTPIIGLGKFNFDNK